MMLLKDKKYLKFNILILVIISFISIGCEKKELVKEEETQVIPVKAIQVKRQDLYETVSYVGNIKAQDEAVVYPKVTGKIIEKLKEEGSPIKKGEVLAYIDRDEVGLKFEKAPIESPLAGIIGRVYVDIGANVIPQTPVALVVNIDKVKVEINVIEKDLPKIEEGQPAQVRVDAYPDEEFEGRVEKVSPVVDLVSRTALVEVGIPNKDYWLKPGMFARVKIVINKKEDVLVIPRDAVIKEDSLNYVFLVKSDNRVYRRRIELGLQEDNRFEVASGLNEAEVVVTLGNSRLKEGDAVEVVKDF